MAKKFYVTTPVYYINDAPSIGSAYPTIVADILARWHRLKEEKIFFLTGTDENSIKTVNAAKKLGFKEVKNYADVMAEKWKETWKKLGISNDGFIRTTESRHKKVLDEVFAKMHKKGDIYKGIYKGLYCEGCEAFFTEKDLLNGECPIHKVKAKEIEEENYFFKLSKYQKSILQHIEKNKDFILPEHRRNEIINFINEGLKDISISRPNQGWGIPLPIDEKQVYWCWLDALFNYISGSEKNWPAELHIVGKDILKFHAVYFTGFLLSAGYKLPKKIFAHGFLTINGQKMSKSLGNAIDPLYLSKKYSIDAVRYYLIRDIPFGSDGDFNEEQLKARLNNELAADLGYLLNRSLKLMENKEIKGEADENLTIELDVNKIESLTEKLELHNAIEEIWSFIRKVNKYVNDKEPWKLKGKELETVLYTIAESLRIISILVSSFLPNASENINKQIGVKNGKLKDCKFNIKKNYKIKKGEVLFKKIE